MANWLQRAASAQHLRPYARLGLAVVGAFQGFLALVAWSLVATPNLPRHGYYYRQAGVESIFAAVAVGAILLTMALAASSVVRAKAGKRVSPWWDSGQALLLVSAIYGAGSGLLCTWLLESRINQAVLLGFFAAVLGTLVVSAVERGRLPVGGIVLSIACAAGVPLIRLTMRNRLGRWDEEEVLIFALIALIIFPLGYLLIRGLLILVAGRGDDSGQGLFALPPPFEVRALEGAYLVRVEAAGLRDASELTVAVNPLSIDIHAPATPPPSDGLLFTTRSSGPLRTRVVLPGPVTAPATSSVADGLITIRVPRDPSSSAPSP